MTIDEWGMKKMANEAVIIRKLRTEHDQPTFTRMIPLSREMKEEVGRTVKEIFDGLGGASLIKSSGDVYIKPNGIDYKPYVHTRPEVIEAAVRYWFAAGAKRVFVFENSTQCNFTRLVFEITGYKRVCRETGAIPIYLDEEPTVTLPFSGRKTVEQGDVDGYDLGSFETSKTVAEKLIAGRDQNLYVSLPKLKTHSMTGVTLGIKNQWGFPRHDHRRFDHNFNLHQKLVDVLSHVRPDITLIEGIEGTIWGHYPTSALAEECIKKFKLLIGSRNVLAADIAGARVFGLLPDDVPHIRLALAQGFLKGDIEVKGDISSLDELDKLRELPPEGRYPTDLHPRFPLDIQVIKGRERACKEGCTSNPLSIIQLCIFDGGGHGGWQIVMGKGHDPAVIDSLPGPILIAGKCAIAEVSERLINRLGKKNVHQSPACNDLQAATEAVCYLSGVNPLKFVPISQARGALILLSSLLHGSKANVARPYANLIKWR